MRTRSPLWLVLVVFAIAAAATAATVTGSVRNGTTGKPASGDEVILLKLASGMQEESRAVTAAGGRFSLEIKDAAAAHLVRVVHQKVNYHQPLPPGTTTVQVEVFDSAPHLAGVSGSIDLMRVQTDSAGGSSPSSVLQVTEMLGVKNLSSPPKTQTSDRSFEIWLPPQAQIDSAMAAGPGGMAVNTAPAPLPEKGHYAFIFPLRPGETKFQISYHLPYAGEANFAPRLSYGVENMAILLPSSMQFSPATQGIFQREIEENGIVVQVAKNVPAGKAPAFRVAGSGVIPREPVGGADSADTQNGAAASPSNRPGGGLGTPETTPDPLHNYRWYILAVLATLLAGGAVWVVNRPRPLVSGVAIGSQEISDAPASDRAALLLEALKEELFQLEAERLEKKISSEDYARAKAGLDETIARALRRRSS